MVRMSIDERRQELVAAALRVIARDGVAAASTRAIAAEAGMPLASFHYAFTSRDELMRAVVIEVTGMEHTEADAELRDFMGSLDPASEAPLSELVRRSLESYLSSLAKNPGREQALLELAFSNLRNPGLSHLSADQYQTYYAAAEVTLNRWETRLGISWSLPVPELARLLIVVLDGITTNWLATRNTEAITATLPAFADFLAGFARVDATAPPADALRSPVASRHR